MLMPPTNMLSHTELNSNRQKNYSDMDTDMESFLFQAEKMWRPTSRCTTNNVILLDIFQSIVNKWKWMRKKECQWFAVYPILWAEGNGLATDALRPCGQSTELGKKLHPVSMDYLQYYIPVQMEFHSISSSFFVWIIPAGFFFLILYLLELTLSNIHMDQMIIFTYCESLHNLWGEKYIRIIIPYIKKNTSL